MERLTSSPYVVDIYGYCGQSTISELAFEGKGIDNLYRLSTALKGVDTPYVLQTKLQIAVMISLGLSHIHSVAADDDKGQDQATIAHYDVNPRNVIITPAGIPKFNDFNIAEFLTWNPETKQQCGFVPRFHDPWWRAPEEMFPFDNSTVDEKVDVYSLGNIFFVLLTGMEPRGKEHKKQRLKNVSNVVASGEYPSFPDEYSNSTDPSIKAIRRGIMLCYEPDPNMRPSSMEIAKGLFAALNDLKETANGQDAMKVKLHSS